MENRIAAMDEEAMASDSRTERQAREAEFERHRYEQLAGEGLAPAGKRGCGDDEKGGFADHGSAFRRGYEPAERM